MNKIDTRINKVENGYTVENRSMSLKTYVAMDLDGVRVILDNFFKDFDGEPSKFKTKKSLSSASYFDEPEDLE